MTFEMLISIVLAMSISLSTAVEKSLGEYVRNDLMTIS